MKKFYPIALAIFCGIFNSSLYGQGFNVAGNATALSCACYEITPAADWQGGSIWNLNPINLSQPFDFNYKIFLGAANPNAPNNCGIGADGMCFVLQNTNTGLSQNGGGLGYQGFPNQSVAIEFDTYQNGWDPAYSHVAIEYNGQVQHPVGTLAGPVQMSSTETYTADNKFHAIEITWDTATQTLSLYFDSVFRLSYAFPGGIISDIFQNNGSNIYWGFTGSTGADCNLQEVCLNFQAAFTAQTFCSDSVSFTNTSKSGLNSIQAYAWNFGDGDTSTQPSPGHLYSHSGTYPVQLVITDESLCTDTAVQSVIVGGLQLTDSIVEPDCRGNSGFAQVVATNGSGHYLVAWNPVPDSILQNGNVYIAKQPAASTYNVYGIDTVLGCADTIQFTYTGVPAKIAKPVYNRTLCFGISTDTINANPAGNPNYTFAWSNDSISSSVVIGATSFSVIITDTLNGCSAVFSDTIMADAQITDSVSLNPHLCGNPANEDLTIVAIGGSGVYTYTVTGVGSNATGLFPALPSGDYNYTIADGLGCSAMDSVTIQQGLAGQSFTVTNDSGVCTGGTLVVTPVGGQGQTFQYQLDGGAYQSGDSFINVPAGTHNIVAKNTSFGCTYPLTTVVNTPGIIYPPVFKPFICYGVNDTINANPHGNTNQSYSWSSGDTIPSIIATGGVYQVTVTNTQNCSAVFSDTIVQDAQVYYANNYVLSLCVNPPHADVTMQGRGGTGSYTYYLFGVDTNTTGLFPKLPPGNYAFAISDSLGCRDQDAFVIPQSDTAATFHVRAYPASCSTVADGEIIVSPTSLQPGPFQYSLNDGPGQADTIFTNVAAGTYTVHIQNTNTQCNYDTTATVTAPQPPPLSISPNPDTLSSAKKTDTVSVSTGFNDPVFSWSPGTGLNCPTCGTVVVGPDSSMNYYLKVYNTGDSGCYEIDTLVVIVLPETVPDSMVMPTAFTPNGDNVNDVFGPVSGVGYFTDLTVKEFKIYNRFGELIHNSTDSWDGRFKGAEQPVGTYAYYIEAQYPDPDNTGKLKTVKMQGAVTLLR